MRAVNGTAFGRPFLPQEDRTLIYRMFTGSRCRIVRAVPYPGGSIGRNTLGTIRYGMENLGRSLLLVDWDCGKSTMVFPEDIELLVEASAA